MSQQRDPAEGEGQQRVRIPTKWKKRKVGKEERKKREKEGKEEEKEGGR